MKKILSFVSALVLLLGMAAFGMAESDRLTFTTTDLNGNTVTEAIAEGYEYVLYNCWEPWCGYCIAEMPDLESCYRAFKEKGILIVGLVNRATYEGYTPEESILQTGVTYPILNYCSAFDPYFTEHSFPASLIVDAEGKTVNPRDMLMDIMLPDAKEEAEAYKNGAYDAYINNPSYAEYEPMFALLKAAAEGGEEELKALSAFFVDGRFSGTDAFYGYLEGSYWKSLFGMLKQA